jgi:hypothetical protein
MNASNLPLPPVPLPGTHLDNWIRSSHAHKPSVEPHRYAQNAESFIPLPMAVEDLGRLPIYDSFDVSEMDFLNKFIPQPNTSTAPSLPLNLGDAGYTAPPVVASRAPLFNSMDTDPYLCVISL